MARRVGSLEQFKGKLERIVLSDNDRTRAQWRGLDLALYRHWDFTMSDALEYSRAKHPQARAAARLLDGAGEVFESWERIQNIAVYVESFPYSGTRVTQIDHLHYHLANHFEEMYVLYERLNTFLGVLRDACASPKASAALDRRMGAMKRELEGAKATRGMHTHIRRFEDRHLSILQRAETLASYVPFFGELFPRVWREKIKWVHHNTRVVGRILDDCFRVVNVAVFEPSGRIRKD